MSKPDIKQTIASNTDELIQQLLGDCAPPTEETFEVKIGPGQRIFHFRVLKTATEVAKMKASATEFHKALKDPKSLPEAWAKHLPVPNEVAGQAFLIHYLSAEPTKISQPQALQLMSIGWVWDHVILEINRHQYASTSKQDVQEIEETKND